jgi:hypothetical protein
MFFEPSDFTYAVMAMPTKNEDNYFWYYPIKNLFT